MKIGVVYIILFSLLCHSCKERSLDEVDKVIDYSTQIAEIEEAVWQLHTADTSLNAQGVLDLMWPESSMLVDGNRLSFNEISTGSKQFMSGLTLFHTVWEDLRVIRLSENTAISSFIFNDSIVNKEGAIIQSKGPNTFIWEKRDDQWKIIFGDADHYAVE